MGRSPVFNGVAAYDIGFEQIRKVANDIREDTSQPLFEPIDFRPLRRLGRVDLQHTYDTTDNAHGECIPAKNDTFLIKIRADISALGARVIEAHEYAHTLFHFREPGKKPYHSNPKRGAFHPDKHEERVCEEFARQLLVPREAVDYFESAESLATNFEIPETFTLLAMRRSRLIIDTMTEWGTLAWCYTASIN